MGAPEVKSPGWAGGFAGFRTAGPAADELLLPDDAVTPNPEPVGAAAAAAVPDELIVAQVRVLQRWLASARVRLGLGAAGLGWGTATVAAAAVGTRSAYLGFRYSEEYRSASAWRVTARSVQL